MSGKKQGKRELVDYLYEKDAELRQKEAKITEERVRLEALIETAEKIIEIRK